eukprot:CAMPEP_0177644904 /NCGR_PEP_ID=MMETSP0447-20121125/8952_1 /TAXON_ID=0 /ORGANISM="Stygamoeba regulata, Strain BSH-02190019" /LENGTH=102 /DNA_ID=CAMNT_0019147327 /DNA_START=89 /DNA_END=393 /DNA_ORIENTATION=-
MSKIKAKDSWKKHKIDVVCMCAFSGMLCSGDEAGTLIFWNEKGKMLKCIERAHPGGLFCLASSDKHLFSAGGDPDMKVIRVWDSKFEKVMELKGHIENINAL